MLVACERSGRVRDAFRLYGHDAWSCDLAAADDQSPYHIQGDALAVIRGGWDLMVCHPPCTYIANSAAPSYPDPALRSAALAFAQALWDAPIDRVCLENPVGAVAEILGRPSQIVQPYQFGHPFTKRTCLWIRGLPPLFSTALVQPTASWVRYCHQKYSHTRRGVEAARTFQGLADAMAMQWG